jgi:hypothetical protein
MKESTHMITLTLTEEKAQAMLELLDLAVKAGGLQTARAAVVLTDDIIGAIKANREAQKGVPPETESPAE